MTFMRTRSWLLVASLTLALLGGCPDSAPDDDSSASPSQSPADTPPDESTPVPTSGQTPEQTFPTPSSSPTLSPTPGTDMDEDGFTIAAHDCDDTDDTVYPGAVEVPYDGVDQDCSGEDLRDVDDDGHEAEAVSGDDCNDADAHTFPGAIEIGDGQDNDCDGEVDEDVDEVDNDGDTFNDLEGDCDDGDASIYPGAAEIPYDGVDQDCSGTDLTDVDGDGVNGGSDGADCDDLSSTVYPGALEVPYDGIDQDCNDADLTDVDGDGVSGGEGGDDCNDEDPSISPQMGETAYDGIDQNCDGKDLRDVDGDGQDSSQVGGLDCVDTDASIYFQAIEFPYDGVDQDCSGEDLTDVDGDFYDSVAVAWGTDCDDSDMNTHPDAIEFADGKDNDCNGLVDDNLDTYDDDGDGLSESEGDCDDGDASTFPEAIEIPYDGIDQNCDGDDLTDVDQDGYEGGDAGSDCDDTASDIYPSALETAYDGIDQDCDGADLLDVDGDGALWSGVGGTDCDDSNPLVHPGASEVPYDGIDQDCTGGDLVDQDFDGYSGTAVGGPDCQDADAAIHPNAVEVCDGVDNNCDEVVDSDAVDRDTFYEDGDHDGFGDPLAEVLSCVDTTAIVPDATDCDDDYADTYPGASESCDGRDNDCDGLVDEGVKATYYADSDGDGFGNASSPILSCALPEGASLLGTDCNDSSASTYPGAPESCDLADNDCDGSIDENVQLTFYYDADGDGFGTSGKTTQACTPPPGYVPNSGDCKDSNDEIYPGAAESCNGIDEDCDGSIDEGVKPTWYQDLDRDNYGNPSTGVQACSAPTNYVSDGTDCNDGNASIHPNANEACNSLDDDCNGSADEGVKTTFWADADEDGFGNVSVTTQSCSLPDGYSSNSSDCDDNNASVHPGAEEVCNGVDEDCDRSIDEGVKTMFYRDADGDTFGSSSTTQLACTAPDGYVASSTDCNDSNGAIHPGATEICNDVDEDCDGAVDEGVIPLFYRDADQDGYGTSTQTVQQCTAPSGYVSSSTDCNDANAAINPSASEVCNGLDENCNNQVDEGLSKTWYQDLDGDSYGNASVTYQACSAPANYVSDNTDCLDSNASVHPGALEYPNSLDDDCDGSIDEGVVYASCKHLLANLPGLASGVYYIDPDGPSGSVASFQVYCDMTTNGGGWTLAMKIDGTLTTFTFSSAHWTTGSVYNTNYPDLDTQEAKLNSYNTVPFDAVMLGMKDSGTVRYLTLNHTGASLLAVIGPGTQVTTSLGRDRWKGLMASGSLQPYCNREGFNPYDSCFWDVDPVGGVARMRIGIISNQENDCCSPDSRIGVGGGGSYCGQDWTNSAGNEATCSPDSGDRHTKAFGYVFIR